MTGPGYEVRFPSAGFEKHFESELKRLPREEILRVRAAVDGLAASPRPPGKKFRFLSPPVHIYEYVAQYRLRVGPYRILYDVDDARRTVWLLAVRRRSEQTYR